VCGLALESNPFDSYIYKYTLKTFVVQFRFSATLIANKIYFT
jgi:hypothetical protein